MKNTLSILSIFVYITLFVGTYITGAYQLATNDKHSKGEMMFGVVAFPYAMYIGGKEIYNNLFQSDDTVKTKRVYTLDEFASYLNDAQELPRMEDKITLAKSITSNGSAIVYTYQITTLKNSKILKDSLEDMFEYAKNKYCEQKRYIDDDRMLEKQNIPMLTKIFDKENELIDEVVFNRASCQ